MLFGTMSTIGGSSATIVLPGGQGSRDEVYTNADGVDTNTTLRKKFISWLFMTDKVRASHILCKHSGSRNPVSRRTGKAVTISKDAAISEIEFLIAQVRKDPGRFAQMAQERSDCGSYSRGGDLGFFGKGEMQKPFEAASM